MKKYFLSGLLMMALSANCFSQTVQPKLDQVKNDPATSENAAKADAGLIDKKNITDSTSAKNITSKRKDRKCKSKRKSKTAS